MTEGFRSEIRESDGSLEATARVVDAGGDDDERIVEAALRPKRLAEFPGQPRVRDQLGLVLQAAKQRGSTPDHVLLSGPPGLGKTTLAMIVAAEIERPIRVTSGPAIQHAGDLAAVLSSLDEGEVLFLDEIHRFNKAQQDALLPAVESGVLTLIGATTENPYFEVNSALISRSQVYELKPLGPPEIETLLRRALDDEEHGVAGQVELDDGALLLLAERTGGDARAALSALERLAAAGGKAGVEQVEDALQAQAIAYDKGGDHHYDYISAWIKATRGSDADASVYYLAVMLEGGEDPRFIARRMVILASEDIGNADPQALLVATAAAAAVDRVGLPEAALNLAQAATYLALAPKSNAATMAIGKAREEVRQNGAKLPPDHLRDSHYPGAAKLGRGEGYRYPHDVAGGVSDQPLMPPEAGTGQYYEPTEYGFEAELKRRKAAADRIRAKGSGGGSAT